MSITIAHRVKTVMNSDVIFVIDKGRVLEQGRFQDLERFAGHHFESEDDMIDVVMHRKTSAASIKISEKADD